MKRLVLDRYRIVRHLTSGGVGDLWLAHDQETLQNVVVKTLREVHQDDAEMRARFLGEAQLLGRLRHAGIVRGIAAGRWDGKHALVTEYIAGITLSELLSSMGRRLAPEWVAHIGASVARALAYLHHQIDVDGNALVHQDVSPQNIMIDTTGRVVLIDLGLASSGARAVGVCQGKPAYMAPEQARAEAVSPAADQFGLALVLVEALCGEKPFDDVPDHRLLSVLGQADTVPLPCGLDGALTALFERMLAPEAGQRFPSLLQVAQVLDAWRCGRGAGPELGAAVAAAMATLSSHRPPDETTTVVEGPHWR